MHEIRTATTIGAPPEAVWAALADTASYGGWNPFIPQLEGRLAVGERLRVRIAPPGGRAMTFRPRVTAAEPGRRLAWLGRLGLPGLFDGEHAFDLEPVAGGTRLTQSERFTGALVPLLRGSLGATEEGFRQMNEALRERVESARTAG